MAPLKVQAALLVMVSVPLEPEAIVIGLANVNAPPPFNVALAEPLESPIVMTLAFAPKALALVVPLTVPLFIVRPVVNVFAPLKVSADVELFWMTPVTLVLMTALIVTPPEPVPELVMVPV
jgi:hypothetical protein